MSTRAKKFTVQIESRIVVSREIRAESLEEAAAEAARIAQSDRITKPVGGWSFEYEVEGTVVAVMA